MKDTIYLTCNKWGVLTMRKTPPKLQSGEIAVKLNVSIPPVVFAEYIPEVSVSIEPTQVRSAPIEIVAEDTEP